MPDGLDVGGVITSYFYYVAFPVVAPKGPYRVVRFHENPTQGPVMLDAEHDFVQPHEAVSFSSVIFLVCAFE